MLNMQTGRVSALRTLSMFLSERRKVLPLSLSLSIVKLSCPERVRVIHLV